METYRYTKVMPMKTIQMTIDEALLSELDAVVKNEGATRSAFIRESIVNYLKKKKIEQLERRHYEGYQRNPVDQDEFREWENEQEWG